MIKLIDLKKTYVSKNGQVCNALNGINLSLPEKGMVFIIGKSGSGKSTLLNMLGGLDSSTGGDIIVDGVSVSTFNENDYDNYRKSYVGFVFQDYCLLESMTIYENIRLSLSLQGENDQELIEKTLSSVGLEGVSNRYPRELSGGQKQRVGIARALVKNPKLILADEPTGNLDSGTTAQVLATLKELSKETLVVIVSHNIADAEKYGDRIIELDDGRVVSDTSRNKSDDSGLIGDNVINLPIGEKLTQDELKSVNEALSTGKYEIMQVSKNFVKTKAPDIENGRPYSVSKASMKFKRNVALSRCFMKGNTLHSIVTAISVSLIIILLSLCQIFMMFNGVDIVKNSITEDTHSIAINKGYRDPQRQAYLIIDTLVEVTDSDIQAFYDEGYEGNIYQLYNTSLVLNKNKWNRFETGNQNELREIESLYISFGRGVLLTDLAFVNKVFANNGELDILAGSLDAEFVPHGIIITDYMADCLIYHSNTLKTYQDVVDAVRHSSNGLNFSVKAIVNTNYKTRHKVIIDKMTDIMKLPTAQDRKSKFVEISGTDEMFNFREELVSYLSIGYYIGDNYEDTFINAWPGLSQYFYFDNPTFTFEGKEIAHGSQYAFVRSSDLEPGQMKMGYSVYNQLFNKNITYSNYQTVEPFEINIKDYPYHSDLVDPFFQKDYDVVGLSNSGLFALSDEDFETLAKAGMYAYGLYFDNPESYADIMESNASLEFFSANAICKAVLSLLDVVTVFEDFFLLLFIGLAFLCVMLVFSYSRRTIRRKYYDIGVIRALGGRNKNVIFAFIIQALIMALAIITIATTGMLLLDETMNNVLLENIVRILDISALKGMTVISFNPLSSFVIIASVLGLSLVSILTMVSFTKKVKPINIIRKNNN